VGNGVKVLREIEVGVVVLPEPTARTRHRPYRPGPQRQQQHRPGPSLTRRWSTNPSKLNILRGKPQGYGNRRKLRWLLLRCPVGDRRSSRRRSCLIRVEGFVRKMYIGLLCIDIATRSWLSRSSDGIAPRSDRDPPCQHVSLIQGHLGGGDGTQSNARGCPIRNMTLETHGIGFRMNRRSRG
jgi:hypothetical protein